MDLMRRLARFAPLGTAALAAALILAVPGHAQQMAPPPNLPPEVQAMLDELEATQVRLEGLQNEAIAGSPELQEKQAEISELVGAAILVVEPQYDELRDRFAQLQQEVAAAQQAQDAQRFSQIMNEAEGVRARLEAAQEKVFEQEEIVAVVEEYQGALLEEMTEIDPETPELLDRMEKLVEELSTFFGPGPGGRG
jgi:DNA repair exonuclease SbcCD ATPase subunit